MGSKKGMGTVINLGDISADVTKTAGGGFEAILIDNQGSRPDIGKISVGNRDMLTEVLSWFTKK